MNSSARSTWETRRVHHSRTCGTRDQNRGYEEPNYREKPLPSDDPKQRKPDITLAK